jgi:hypothetical protein
MRSIPSNTDGAILRSSGSLTLPPSRSYPLWQLGSNRHGSVSSVLRPIRRGVIAPLSQLGSMTPSGSQSSSLATKPMEPDGRTQSSQLSCATVPCAGPSNLEQLRTAGPSAFYIVSKMSPICGATSIFGLPCAAASKTGVSAAAETIVARTTGMTTHLPMSQSTMSHCPLQLCLWQVQVWKWQILLQKSVAASGEP